MVPLAQPLQCLPTCPEAEVRPSSIVLLNTPACLGLCFPHLSNRNSSREAQPQQGPGAILEKQCWLSQRQLLHSRGEEVGAVTGGLQGLQEAL